MKFTNKFNLPRPVVSAIKNDLYWNPCDIGTTTLISPPRIRVLRKRNIIEDDVSNWIFPLCGNNTHAILERMTEPSCLKEWRFYQYVNGWLLSGQIDLYEYPNKILSDYKLTSVWSFINGLKPEHEAQMNVNRFLMINSIYKDYVPVEKLQIVNIFRDWSKFKAMNDKNYPKCQIGIQDVPIWKDRYTLDFVHKRIWLHQTSETKESNDLPECSPEERWEKPTKYAVMKKGRKSAIRLLESLDDAKNYMILHSLDEKHYIDIRKGESVRCEHYCNVNIFCNQYAKMKGE